MAKLQRVAIDTEGTGLNPWRGAKPFAVSACFDNGETLYWEWTVDPKTRQPRVPEEDRKYLNELLGRKDLVKCFWNSQYDILLLSMIGITVKWPIAEVTFMARSVCNMEFSYALKPLSEKYLGIGTEDQKDLRDTVVKCRRHAKKLGWTVATKDTHGKTPWMSDYWLPETLWRLKPKIAKANKIPRGLCETYAITDVERTILLDAFYNTAMDDLDADDPKLRCRVTYEREMELLPVTMDMERIGVTVDERRLKKLRVACHRKIEVEMEILRGASLREDFNFNSAQHIQQLLFEPLAEGATTPKGKPKKPAVDKERCLNLPVDRRTDTDMPKTDAEALMPYAMNPIVRAVISAKANSKADATFFKAYGKLAIPDDDGNLVLHPRWQQTAAKTARFTCREPNMQQVSNPLTTNSRSAEFVVNVRQAFIPRKHEVYVYRWYAPDYSQVEVLIFADIAGVETMLDAIRKGADIHTATTNKIWGGRENGDKAMMAASKALQMAGDPRWDSDSDVEGLLELVDWDICELESALDVKIWRKLAKTVTFTKIFGGGPNALMSWIGCDKPAAIAILADYDNAFPEMKEKMNDLAHQGRVDGYVINPWGRRLEIDRHYSYRAVNYLVQSAAADLMKDGMIACAKYLKKRGIDGRIAMTIHDELIFEIRTTHCTIKLLRKLIALMADHGGRFSIPISVDMERIDERWSKKMKVKLGAVS